MVFAKEENMMQFQSLAVRLIQNFTPIWQGSFQYY
jgi:hypothetical protein